MKKQFPITCIVLWICLSSSSTIASLSTNKTTASLNKGSSVARSVDIVSFQSTRGGTWFSVDLSALPETSVDPGASFDVKETVIDNRNNGKISSTLLAGYFFVQWDISSSSFDQYDHTIVNAINKLT